MAYQNEDNLSAALLPLLTGTGDNPLAQALGVLLNAAMQIERERHIGAEAYARCEERNGQANGFKERTISTRLGQIAVSVPQVRNSSEAFRPQSLEAALLSEKALKVALAEMYVQGVSTRRVSAVLESLCGTSVSSMTGAPLCSAVQTTTAPQKNWTKCFVRGLSSVPHCTGAHPSAGRVSLRSVRCTFRCTLV